MIIGIDFDDVLFPTMQTVIDIYNERHNTNLKMTDITSYKFCDCLDDSVAKEFISITNEQMLYDRLKPFNKAVQVISTLIKRGHKVIIATATDAKNLCWKEELLEEFFPFIPKTDVIKIHEKGLLRVDVLIDDCLNQLISNFCERICFDRPWNRNKDKDFVHDIYRVSSWNEVMNIINDIERKDEEWTM